MKGLMTPVFSPDGKRFAAIEGGAINREAALGITTSPAESSS